MEGLGRTLWTELAPVVIVLCIMGESDLRRRNAKSTAVSETSGMVGAGWHVSIQLPLAVFYQQLMRPRCYHFERRSVEGHCKYMLDGWKISLIGR